MALPILLSTPPSELASAASISDGVEVKLDWSDAADLSAERTLTDICNEQDVDPATVGSVHLPPGTTQRHGMAIAPGNRGRIINVTHQAFGESLNPAWITVHSARSFEYREHVELLEQLTRVTDQRFALENTPDESQLYTPEDVAVFAVLAARTEKLDDVYLLVDTVHVPERRSVAVDERAVEAVLERMEKDLRRRFEPAFRAHLSERVAAADVPLPAEDHWYPPLTMLHLVGGDRIRAVHLNDPLEDGIPDVRTASEGLATVIEFCRQYDVVIVLEPGQAKTSEIVDAIEWIHAES